MITGVHNVRERQEYLTLSLCAPGDTILIVNAAPGIGVIFLYSQAQT